MDYRCHSVLSSSGVAVNTLARHTCKELKHAIRQLQIKLSMRDYQVSRLPHAAAYAPRTGNPTDHPRQPAPSVAPSREPQHATKPFRLLKSILERPFAHALGAPPLDVVSGLVKSSAALLDEQQRKNLHLTMASSPLYMLVTRKPACTPQSVQAQSSSMQPHMRIYTISLHTTVKTSSPVTIE